jgi:acyl-CoA synthetase (AMP-forming)/AMP-acid ligase II
MMNAMQFGLRDLALREPNRPAVNEVDGQQTSFGELEALANKFAHLLRKTGLKRGDNVAAVLGNGPHILALAWATYRAGPYFAPVANTFSTGEVAYVVENSQAKAVIVDHRFSATVEGLPQARGITRHLFALGGPINSFDPLEPLLATMPCEPIADELPGAIMLYSSGTTGAPKGIWRPLPTAEQVGDGPPPFARDLIALFDIRSSDRYLSTAPLYHAAPLRWSLAAITAGGSVVLMGKFDADLALSLLERERNVPMGSHHVSSHAGTSRRTAAALQRAEPQGGVSRRSPYFYSAEAGDDRTVGADHSRILRRIGERRALLDHDRRVAAQTGLGRKVAQGCASHPG